MIRACRCGCGKLIPITCLMGYWKGHHPKGNLFGGRPHRWNGVVGLAHPLFKGKYGLYQTASNKRWWVRTRSRAPEAWSRILMRNQMGRDLLPNEHVHHVNNDKSDDSLSNLMLMTKSEHSRLHAIERWDNDKLYL